ncbi:hypothetical protein SPRG_06323 [Saprolegnia parasitica CBS 223.65]|uniref:Programmed cell death protein 2 C-terminal domain-containing protein n=1 Tax=Saprolegnia parasitica (strain CBS 223.65) TaxID=695850 RepID=A0A067CN94_SAPPC|nr:hypothetical protein SPRG_06323 [Saprolegnia parasitica CBS 223.65]KDO28272.1 hypothetical protein SPRG_06323 [Saprolegnia parasitica CBS 223.65]|eukprot:XP_012201092.1 hypothetical protein SPRG_06323 [Saprolegnia parasitica CBS 223.65]
MSEEASILLGLPAKDVAVDDACPYTAKLGGLPAYYDPATSLPYEDLVCPRCQHQLYLVAQVYAPVTTDRTLYIFGCNSIKCTTTPNRRAAAARPAATPGWGDDDDDDDDWGDVGTSAWGAPVAATSSTVDLEALLDARDSAMTTKVASAPAKPKATSTTTSASARPHFPAISLHVEDEPESAGAERYQHETQLLNAYLAEEEKENATEVARLKTILKAKTDVVASSAGESESVEAYERTPLREKLFLRFQKRMKRAPTQCLRYHYGGNPLWSSPPPKIDVPPCPCGASRVFELQLVPTTNYFLNVEKYAHETHTEGAGIVLGGGMDWQTVLVWSCPDSCTRSHEEFVYVQPVTDASTKPQLD